MLINYCCRLRAAVAIRAVEIEAGDAMLAESAFECGAAIHRFGCVISHIFIVVLLPVPFQFVQFFAEFTEAVIPLGVSVHFSGHIRERPDCVLH